MIYVNGDSYMTPVDGGKDVSHFLSEKLKLSSINKSIRGSSNSRILRTSMRDLLMLKKENPNIVAIIGLSFIYRQSIWDPIGQAERWKYQNDGEFASYQMFTEETWLEKIKGNRRVHNLPSHIKSYVKEWAKLYDIEAETTILLQQVELFSSWCKLNGINCFIFSSPDQEKVDFSAPFIKPYYDAICENKNVIHLFDFSFLKFCKANNFVGVDVDQCGDFAHHGQSAFDKFSDFLLENYIL
jgi:hypothetical protein